jgi:hypothetical protein
MIPFSEEQKMPAKKNTKAPKAKAKAKKIIRKPQPREVEGHQMDEAKTGAKISSKISAKTGAKVS